MLTHEINKITFSFAKKGLGRKTLENFCLIFNVFKEITTIRTARIEVCEQPMKFFKLELFVSYIAAYMVCSHSRSVNINKNASIEVEIGLSKVF